MNQPQLFDLPGKPVAKITHKDLIRKHLEKYGSITSWKAITMYGNTRLAEYISRLKEDGMKIESERITVTTRIGRTQVARYTMKKNS